MTDEEIIKHNEMAMKPYSRRRCFHPVIISRAYAERMSKIDVEYWKEHKHEFIIRLDKKT